MSASDQDTQAAEPPEADEAPASDGTGEKTAPGTPRKSPEPTGAPRSERAEGAAELEKPQQSRQSEGSQKPERPERPEKREEAAGVHEPAREHMDDLRAGAAESDAEEEPEEAPVPAAGLTPKQARRLRVAVASVLLVATAVVLVIRLASRTSVLVVGVYGLAMILCGVVIELSRNGRTRLGTWLLVGGLLGALALDWLVLP
ncbi:hypothetical protein ACIQCR_03455 [Streptomyces sp. NPDC093249]|uniref:hypothetical protein n=1 Tax=unclassified Streptomyces TaxID=2593676 RepID=UPI003825C926